MPATSACMAHCASSLRAEEPRSHCLDPVRAPGSAAPQVALPPAGGALDARPLARSLGSSWAAALAVAHRRSSRSRRPRHLPRHLPAHDGPWAARPAAAAPAGGHMSWRCAWIVRGRWSGYAPSTLAGARGCRATGAARRALRRRPGDAARAVRGGHLSTWPAHILMSWMKLRWSSSMYLEAMLRAESSSSRQLEPESTSVVEPRSAPAGPKAAASAY